MGLNSGISYPRSVLVVTGEASGDQHLSGVIREFERRFAGSDVRWFGSGGIGLAQQGVELLEDVSSLAAIGPLEALSNLSAYVRLFRRVLKEAQRRRPSLAVLVDFPEFNLRLAPRLKAMGMTVCYFISPQVWAWRPSRVEQIRRSVDRMLVILPFEEEFFRKHGVDARYVGNPLAELRPVHGARQVPPRPEEQLPRVALMPGSRRKEITRILPVQLEAARCLSQRHPCRFWVIKAPGVDAPWLASLCEKWQQAAGISLQLEVRQETSADLLQQVDCAIIKSGTSTLQAMVLEVPFVMVYRMAELSYRLLRPWVKTHTYCLANLVAGKKVVPEFVQSEAKGEKIAEYLLELLNSPASRREVKQNLRSASETLGTRNAYAETAQQIAQLLEDTR